MASDGLGRMPQSMTFLVNPILLAGSTGLEPAASGVTGRRSNQLNYDPKWWAVQDSNLWQPACKAGALPLS